MVRISKNRNKRNREDRGNWIIFIRKMMRLILVSISGLCRLLRSNRKLRKRRKFRKEISFNGFNECVKLRNLYPMIITQLILRDLHHKVQVRNSVKNNKNKNKSKNKHKYLNKNSHKNQENSNNN